MCRSLRLFELWSSIAHGLHCPWLVDSIYGISFRLSALFRLSFQCWKRETIWHSRESAEHLNLPPIIRNSIVWKSFFRRTQNWYHLLKTDSCLESYVAVNKTATFGLFPQFIAVLRENTRDSLKCKIVLTRGKHLIIFLLDKAMLWRHKQRSVESTSDFVNQHDNHRYAIVGLFRKSRFHFTFVLVLNNTEQYK